MKTKTPSAKLMLVLVLSVILQPTAQAARCDDYISHVLRTFDYGKNPTGPTIYVRRNSEPNSQHDGSFQHPYNNIQEAAPHAVPGSEIIIVGPTDSSYGEVLLQGTADEPIWIRGQTNSRGEGGKISGSASQGISPLKLQAESQYVVMDDFEVVVGGEGHALHMAFVHHIVMRRLKVGYAREAALKVSQSEHIYVEDGEYWGAGELPWGNPVSSQVIDFVRVRFFHIVRNFIHTGPHTLVMLKGGSEDGFVGWNKIGSMTEFPWGGYSQEPAIGLGQSTGSNIYNCENLQLPCIPDPSFLDYEGKRLTAAYNYIYDTGTPFAFKGCHNCAAVHNTMVGIAPDGSSGPQIVRFLTGTAGSNSGMPFAQTKNSLFMGNIVLGGGEWEPIVQCEEGMNSGIPALGAGNRITDNLFFDYTNSYTWWCGGIQNDPSNIMGIDPGLDGEGIPSNVGAVSHEGPASFAGIYMGRVLVKDLAGQCQSVAPQDIGAYRVSP